VAWVSFGPIVPGTFCHLFEPFGFFSRTYFSIFDPPVSLGGFHSSVMEVGVVSIASSGPSGDDGLSEIYLIK